MLAVEMLSEPNAISDAHVSGALVEDADDGNIRITLYTSRESGYGTEHRVEYRFVMGPVSALSLMKYMMRKLGYACCGAGRRVAH